MKNLFIGLSLAVSFASAGNWFVSSIEKDHYRVCAYEETQRAFLKATASSEYSDSERRRFFQQFIVDTDQNPELAAFVELELLVEGRCKDVLTLDGLRVIASSVVVLQKAIN